MWTFFDTFLSFIGLLLNPSSRETNQMWTDFTRSCCRIRKGEKSSENYQDNYDGVACISFPPFLYVVFGSFFSESSSYTVNVIVLSHPVCIWLSSLNSLWNPFIYCYRNKMFRKACKELVRMKCSNFDVE